MKLAKMAIAAAIAWGSCTGFVLAQQPTANDPAQSISYATDYYDLAQQAQPSPSDQPVPMNKMVQAPGACCVSDAVEEEACPPWRLFCQKECGWNVYGYVDFGAATNDDASFFNGPVTFPDYSDAYMNQLYAIVENKIDTGGCGCDWGGRIDILYGTDYIFTQQTGFETHDDGSPHWNGGPWYGVAVPQLFLNVGYNDLDLKLGRFYTPIAYEVVNSNGNFFYTHAITHQYFEPFGHTGGLATLKRSENVSLLGGFVNGWDNFDRENDTGAFIGGILWNNGCGLSVALTGIVSPNEARNPLITAPTLDTNRDMYAVVVSYEISDDLLYVFEHDNGYQREGSVFTNGATSAEFYSITQYLFYTINDCWKAGTRFEWSRDDDGARIGGIRANNPLPLGGFAGNFYELTMGLNWSPHANWTLRPEIRYDWFDGESFTGVDPYDTDNRPGDDEQFMAAMDVIFLW